MGKGVRVMRRVYRTNFIGSFDDQTRSDRSYLENESFESSATILVFWIDVWEGYFWHVCGLSLEDDRVANIYEQTAADTSKLRKQRWLVEKKAVEVHLEERTSRISCTTHSAAKTFGKRMAKWMRSPSEQNIPTDIHTFFLDHASLSQHVLSDNSKCMQTSVVRFFPIFTSLHKV